MATDWLTQALTSVGEADTELSPETLDAWYREVAGAEAPAWNDDADAAASGWAEVSGAPRTGRGRWLVVAAIAAAAAVVAAVVLTRHDGRVEGPADTSLPEVVAPFATTTFDMPSVPSRGFPALVAGDRVWFSSGAAGSPLAVMDPASGAEVARFDVPFASAAGLDGDLLWVVQKNLVPELAVIDIRTLSLTTKATFGNTNRANGFVVAAHGGRVYYDDDLRFTHEDVVAIDGATGAETGRRTAYGMATPTGFATDGSLFLAIVQGHARLERRDPVTMLPLGDYAVEVPAPLSPGSSNWGTDGHDVWIVGSGLELLRIDGDTGELVAVAVTGCPADGASLATGVVVAGGAVYWGCQFRLGTGATFIRRFDIATKVTTTAWRDDSAERPCSTGHLYSVDGAPWVVTRCQDPGSPLAGVTGSTLRFRRIDVAG